MAEVVLRRGDVVVSALTGDYGKPRPAVVVQSDLFNGTHESVVLCPISSELTGANLFRVPLGSSTASGLKRNSEAMVDKLTVCRRQRIAQRIGKLSPAQSSAMNAALRLWLDLPSQAS